MKNLISTQWLLQIGMNAVLFLLALILLWIVAGYTKRAVSKALSKSGLDQNLSDFLSSLARWAVLIVGFTSCLGMFGIQTASFAAVFASVGIAVGMALQGTLGNFAAGTMILMFRPVKAGDVVNIGGVKGTIHRIDIFSTLIDTPDNVRISVPNGNVFGHAIEIANFHETRRVDVTVGTDYSADLDETRKVLLSSLEGIGEILPDPAPAVVLADLGDSSVNWVVRVWVKTPDYWGVKEQLTESVKNSLDQAKIGIPFPQVELHKTW